MAAQQGIKRRIKSVTNTRQITKAMQMVAASKLRRAQDAALGPKAFVEAASGVLNGLSASPEARLNPLFVAKPNLKNGLVIVISSDRGLAGAYVGNIDKTLQKHAFESKLALQVICVGKTVSGHVARLSDVDQLSAYNIDGGDSDIELAQPILKEAMDAFITGNIDVVDVIYTKFHSTIRQEAVVERLLPIEASAAGATPMTLEPSPEELVEFAAKRLLEARILQAILESRASEHASRMLAMKNATDNANDLIDDLTLEFNNARQAAITQELAEISAGAEAING